MFEIGLAFIAINGFFVIYGVQRTAWYSPAVFWSLFCMLNIAVLLGVIQANVHLPQLMLSPMPSIRLDEFFVQTGLVFTAFSAIGPLSVMGLRRDLGHQEAFRKIFRDAYSSSAATVYAAFIFIWALTHLALIDKGTLYLNSEYLALSDPLKNGVGAGFGALINNSLRPLGVPAFMLLALKPPGRIDAKMMLLALACSYLMAFSLAVYSRYSVVFIFIYILGRVLGHKSISVREMILLPALIVTFFGAFIVVILGRGYQFQGLASIPLVLETLDTSLIRYFATKFVVLTFDGGLNLANTMRINPSFAIEYKLLSFSPFPSFIDGFSDIRMVHQVRITRVVPVGSFGETYFFGVGYVGAFFVICLFVIRQITVGIFRYRDLATITAYPVLLISVMKFQTYTLRTSLRLFVIIALVSLISCWLTRHRRRRQQARGGAARA